MNNTYLMPAPHGPAVAGIDLLESEILRMLSGLPQTKVFIDDQQYHRWSGNVHCGTNVLREGFSQLWWESGVK